MSEEALLINPGNDEPKPEKSFDQAYADELGIHAPRTDAEKREADYIASLPHETRSSAKTEDELEEFREITHANPQLRDCEWQRQEELSEAHQDERTGRILTASQFIGLLWRCGLTCVLTRPNVEAIRYSMKSHEYTQERRAQIARTQAGLVVQQCAIVSLPRPEYATWVQIPAMIEYSVMRFDSHNLPTNEKYRGWRTVLIELIRKGFLTERKANEVFGEARGPAARRWQEIMQAIRTNQGIC